MGEELDTNYYETQDINVGRVTCSQEDKSMLVDSSIRHFEINLKDPVDGRRRYFTARLGIVDLEFKMYSKLKAYST